MLETFTDYTRKLDASKLMIKPINDIKELTGFVPVGERRDMNRLVIFQNHDTQMLNLLHLLNPDYFFNGVPYAANLRVELYVRGKIFHVKTLYNNREFLFRKFCSTPGQVCPIDKWLMALGDVVFTDMQDVLSRC